MKVLLNILFLLGLIGGLFVAVRAVADERNIRWHLVAIGLICAIGFGMLYLHPMVNEVWSTRSLVIGRHL
jgi:hypothetical protein